LVKGGWFAEFKGFEFPYDVLPDSFL